jgi:hypothetical protein
MFRHRHRRPAPFADFINWTDYRWENSPWRSAAAGPRPWGLPHPRRREYSFLQVLLAGLAVVLGIKLMASLRNSRNRSWIEKGVIAVLLLMVASYVSKRAGQRRW